MTPAIWPRWRSRGSATLVATVVGLAPGSCALTEMVGKSTWGRGATGNLRKANTPANAIPSVSKVVATGRLMNGADMFIQPELLGSFASDYNRCQCRPVDQVG